MDPSWFNPLILLIRFDPATFVSTHFLSDLIKFHKSIIARSQLIQLPTIQFLNYTSNLIARDNISDKLLLLFQKNLLIPVTPKSPTSPRFRPTTPKYDDVAVPRVPVSLRMIVDPSSFDAAVFIVQKALHFTRAIRSDAKFSCCLPRSKEKYENVPYILIIFTAYFVF